jgi:hypothetical protein
MKAGRIHYFGPPNAIVIDEIPCPRPKEGELVVRVAAPELAHGTRSFGRERALCKCPFLSFSGQIWRDRRVPSMRYSTRPEARRSIVHSVF